MSLASRPAARFSRRPGSIGESSNPYSERRWRPIVWWEITALQPRQNLLFADLFVECFGEAVVSCRKLSMELKMQDSVEPVHEWQVISIDYIDPADAQWGDLGREITEWFSDGDCMTSGLTVQPSIAAGLDLGFELESHTTMPAWIRTIRSIPAFLGLF